jgi:hypothetical protein
VKTYLERLKPGVSNVWLLLLGGVVWTLAGSILCGKAFAMLANDSHSNVLGAAGAVVAVAWNHLMFKKVAQKGVGRIVLLPKRVCIFAFAPWKSYAMIVTMIILGIILRNSAMPKPFLGVAYLAMGGTLLLSSVVFYQSFIAQRRMIP